MSRKYFGRKRFSCPSRVSSIRVIVRIVRVSSFLRRPVDVKENRSQRGSFVRVVTSSVVGKQVCRQEEDYR